GVGDCSAADQVLYTELGLSPLKAVNLHCLADICDRCAQEGVELVAFVPPKPDFGLINMQEYYEEYTRQVKGLVEGHGGSYYDFNLAKPDLFESQESYYWDWEHLNSAGADVFSRSLVALLGEKAAGEDVDALFMTYDEKLESIDSISIVTLDAEVTREGITLNAQALAGTNVKPEYQFLVAKRDGAFEVVQDYSPSNTCTFDPGHHGRFTVRVNVRQQGSDVEFEKYTQEEIASSRRRAGE
ncbi:MAG: hypothetical protein IJ111_09450, partial [Eggerthellaceae bacterium]|nr:hypothetical protein [Eggerthellaceae bacterium]